MAGQIQHVRVSPGSRADVGSCRPTRAAISLRAAIRDGELGPLQRALRAADADVRAGRSPLTLIEAVHFARWTIVPGDHSLAGGGVGDSLLYTADVDDSADDHLRQLAERAGSLLDAVFSHCVDYPTAGADGSRHDWLLAHRIRNAATYVNATGFTVARIGLESKITARLQEQLDHRDAELRRRRPSEIHGLLRNAVASDPDLAPGLRRAEPEPVGVRAKRWLILVGAAVVLLALLPVVIIVGGAGLLAIRRLERHDVPEIARPDPVQVQRLRSREDEFALNPFGALGVVKDGWLRATTVKIVLVGISLAASCVFTRGSLAGVTTIHAARWVALDEGRRMIFTSCYDGSLESYMDDFIDKLAWGLNVIFSNGVGYPRTRWLIFGGARDEQSFKDYLRRHQLETAVSYAAHPTLTAANIRTNAAIRRGLSAVALDDRRASEWLALL